MKQAIFFVFFIIFLFVPVIQADENANHIESLSKHYKLEKPSGTEPFPAVILVSECSGFDAEFSKNHYNHVQNELLKLGFVTLRVNYLAARNAKNCMKVPTWDVADDICIAAKYLNQQSFVKKGAVNVIGWSWGGASAFRALRSLKRREPAQVDAVVAYYPYCNHARHWDSEVPVLVLGGALDTVSVFTSCDTIFNRLPKRDKLTVIVYENARHAFDNFDLPAEKQYQFGTLGYNEAAAKAAWIEVTKFLHK